MTCEHELKVKQLRTIIRKQAKVLDRARNWSKMSQTSIARYKKQRALDSDFKKELKTMDPELYWEIVKTINKWE